MSELFRKMEKAMSFVEAYKSDYEIDKKTLQDEHLESKEFYWILRKHGTELLYSPLVFMKDSYSNISAYSWLESGDIKVYKITLTSRDENGAEGVLKLIKNFKEIMDEHSAYATELTGKFYSHDGKVVEVKMDYEKDYFEAFLDKIGWRRDDVKEYHLINIKF